MNRTSLQMAIDEAERFLSRARQLNAKMHADKVTHLIAGTRLSGEVRRASLDLSRALSDLRSPS